MPKSKTWSYM
ncbi:hypothetical protein F383_38508 [Gossypium arboreum]|uniref:Uncharacterized protein n=1 Tax=Gossypium arboreum TaxID=29729 RepID=A0A0B0MBF9_GOSAR|nr:hypothetical protein F383_38508 [Gossypium arboreum]